MALAARSGVSLRTIQDIEKGKGTTVSTVYALATALGVTAGDLLDDKSDSPADATIDDEVRSLQRALAAALGVEVADLLDADEQAS